jgi:hypothetical protein
LVPYFAVVAGPVLVLNVQAWAARRAARPSGLNARAAFTRAYLVAMGRALTFVAVAALAVLAWPGWLAVDANAHRPARRVAWELEPDATQERAARQLADWYAAGKLRPGEDRGFHLQPEFALVCAWFCPQEKGLIDSRLAAPDEVAVDYARARRGLLDIAMHGPSADAPAAPWPALRKHGVTHLVLTGVPLKPFPFVPQALWRDPQQFPFWAVTGRGVIYGWNDPARPARSARADLRVDAVALAFGPGAVRVESPDMLPPPPEPSVWARFLRAPAPVPPETYEAALWVAYRDTPMSRAQVAALAWEGLALNLATGPGGAVALQRLLLASPVGQVVPQVARGVVYQRLPDRAVANAAPILAVRAARRAIFANPDDYEAYARLGQAYPLTASEAQPSYDLDVLRWLQMRAALTLAVERLPTAGRPSAADAFSAYQQLFALYQGVPNPPGPRPVRPPYFLDLAVEALRHMVELHAEAVKDGLPRTPDQAAAEAKGMAERLQQMEQEVQRQRDNYVTAAASQPSLAARFGQAYGRGLAREALAELRGAAPEDLRPLLAQWVELELFAGDVRQAREILLSPDLNPVTRLPPNVQATFRELNILAAAAVGDYDRADGELTAAEALLRPIIEQVTPMQARIVAQALVVPANPVFAAPLASIKLELFESAAQLSQPHLAKTRYHLWHGLLALEAGNTDLAGRQFNLARMYGTARLYGSLLGK